jgi:hypothetical protein
MPDNLLTIGAVAGLEPEAKGFPLSADQRKEFVDNLTAHARSFETLAPFDLGERLFGFIGESLRAPLADLLAETWRQRKELADAAKGGTPAKPVVGEIELFDHTMSLTVHPAVELRLNGKEVGKMTFDVTATMKLEAIKLVMRNAHITGFEAGRIKATVSMQYKEFPLMAPQEKEINLSREFVLPAGGIPLV